MMTPAERLIMEAYDENNQAALLICQAMGEIADDSFDFDPKESLTAAIALQTQASIKLTQAKDLLPK